MRPPDDNPPGSKSPQTVLHTRSKDGHNDSTLARLERAGPRGSRSAGERFVRLALLGGSCLLVFGLVSVLVSLTRDHVATPPIVEAADPGPLPAAAGEPAPPIIDERDNRHITTVDTADPPALVRMASDRGDRPDPPSPAIVAAKPVAAQAPVLKAAPAPKPVPASAVAVALKSAPKPALKTVAPLAPAAVKRTRVVPAPVRAEAAVVDTDVALLSAILSQSTRHSGDRAEQEAAACAEAMALSRRCTDRPASLRP